MSNSTNGVMRGDLKDIREPRGRMNDNLERMSADLAACRWLLTAFLAIFIPETFVEFCVFANLNAALQSSDRKPDDRFQSSKSPADDREKAIELRADDRFRAYDERFKAIEVRADDRQKAIDDRFKAMNARFDRLEAMLSRALAKP